MKLIVACVPKEYDLNKITRVYPDSAIYVTTKTESEDKVKEQIRNITTIVYDSDYLSDTINQHINYAKSLPNKILRDLKEIQYD